MAALGPPLTAQHPVGMPLCARTVHEYRYRPVHNGYGHVEGVLVQFELLSHFHQPVHQNTPHALSDIRLLLHVQGIGVESDLNSWRGQMNLLNCLDYPMNASTNLTAHAPQHL